MRTLHENKLLIVDDDPLQLANAIKCFGQHFHITTALSGAEALELMETEHFNMVLLDINLGAQQMDGCTVMRNIRQSSKNKYIKLVAVSVYAGARDWYISQGFDELIIKPLLATNIIDVLENLQNGDGHWWALNHEEFLA